MSIIIKFKIALPMLFCVVNLTSSFSQHSQIRFQNISTDHGLSQSNVICILQDAKGFMWFGTRDGLNKFDGYGFSVYKSTENDNSLSNNTIIGLLQDAEGKIWIATKGGGLNVFDPRLEKFDNFKSDPHDGSSLSDNFINVIYEDRKGNLWIGTNSGGLNLFNKKNNTFKRFVHDKNNPKSIGSNAIHSIYEDRRNNIWVGTETGGLNLFDIHKQEFVSFQHDPNNPKSISHNFAKKIFEDSKGNFWIGTYGGGLNYFDIELKEFRNFRRDESNPFSLSHDFIHAIEEDEEGNLWIGTENGGLNILQTETNTFHHYLHNKTDNMSLGHNSVYSLYKDNKGNIWVGTYTGGVSLYNIDSKKFKHFKNNGSANSLSDNNVLCFFEDSEENIWIGTDGGGLNLYSKAERKFSHYRHNSKDKNSISGDYILSVYEDSDKNLWIGTWGEGVTRFDKKKNEYRHFKHNNYDPSSLGSNNGWVIFEDSDQDLWIGTYYGGLNLFNKKSQTFSRFVFDENDDSSISSNIVYTIFEDSQKNLWIGTDGGGLNLFDKKNGKFTRFLHDEDHNSISNNIVSCIYESTDGFLWISTDAGLNKFDPKTQTFQTFKEKDGLPNDMVFGILEDKNTLWMSTNRGLSRFDPSTQSFKNYTIADGLQHNEFKRQAFMKTRSGTMYFGGINGFNEFVPNHVKEVPFNPPLVFTGFQLFNKKVPINATKKVAGQLNKHINYTDEILLSHDQSVMTIEFASLNYTTEEKKRYSYKLEGFDKEWNQVGTKREVSYTNLDPGEYVFNVKGLNNEGEWSEVASVLKLSISPPYWKTWWFRANVIVFLVGFAYTGYQFRVNRIIRQKAELEKQVRERTAEVVMQKEELVAQSEKLEELYNEIKDSILSAQNIQQAILPSPSQIRKYLPDFFVLNKPKDVVSGDFYWFDIINDQIVLAVADCTGHGVSGAFMSINGHHLLNQGIYGHVELKASEILNRLNGGIIKELHHSENGFSSPIGMDIALCIIDKDKKNLQFAGANNPLYLIRNNELVQVKANRFSIGLTISGRSFTFTNNEIPLMKDDRLYLFSDGFADQIGGEGEVVKFMYPKFRELLLHIHQYEMSKQAVLLEEAFEKWKGPYEQLDDIMVIGLKI